MSRSSSSSCPWCPLKWQRQTRRVHSLLLMGPSSGRPDCRRDSFWKIQYRWYKSQSFVLRLKLSLKAWCSYTRSPAIRIPASTYNNCEEWSFVDLIHARAMFVLFFWGRSDPLLSLVCPARRPESIGLAALGHRMRWTLYWNRWNGIGNTNSHRLREMPLSLRWMGTRQPMRWR